ncbi:c-type cytochrome [Falsiroseomonas bella]|uniref:c-type cytochrome n=1 Tax=Falsiroseomonas bella TaxID=2184016 RepID=UPI0018EEC21C|nr:c-type cytochrome [Falsiroseomonas bella]
MSVSRTVLLGTVLAAGGAAAQDASGDAATGRALAAAHGCTACHVIPGLRGLGSHVGPSLAGIGGGRYIAGVLPNTPENLVRWLRDPPAVAPGTAMPALGLDEATARHIAAFLATLR